jgi:hypothetical protein
MRKQSRRLGKAARRGRGIVASVAAALLFGAVAAAPAGAVWTAPVDLGVGGGPQVAIDADGDAIFVWEGFDGVNTRIQARARAADGTLSPVRTLSGAGQPASGPQVAIDADGDAVFTWTRPDGANYRVQARARAADGTLSPVQTLSGAGQDAGGSQVAIDADGDAVFTWERFDGVSNRVQGRARAANGTLSPVQTLSGAGQVAFSAQVAIDADGDAVFTWTRFDGVSYRIQARARTAAGTLSAVQTLSGAGQDAQKSQVGVDADGDAVFTWERFSGTIWRIQARARAAGGTLSPVQVLSAGPNNAFDPQLGVDAAGDAVFTWWRVDGGATRVQARARDAGGVLAATQDLTGAITVGSVELPLPQVAIDADGDAVFAWLEEDASNSVLVQARTRSAAGVLGSPAALSPAGEDVDSAEVAIDPDGGAAAIWRTADLASTIRGAFGP